MKKRAKKVRPASTAQLIREIHTLVRGMALQHGVALSKRG